MKKFVWTLAKRLLTCQNPNWQNKFPVAQIFRIWYYMIPWLLTKNKVGLFSGVSFYNLLWAKRIRNIYFILRVNFKNIMIYGNYWAYELTSTWTIKYKGAFREYRGEKIYRGMKKTKRVIKNTRMLVWCNTIAKSKKDLLLSELYTSKSCEY